MAELPPRPDDSTPLSPDAEKTIGDDIAMSEAKAERILQALADDHPYPAMVIDRILLLVGEHDGPQAVNRLIDRCRLTARFGIRKVWPD
jgi:hypothetical protein